MRNRNHAILVRFSEEEFAQLDKKVSKTSFSREAFIRAAVKNIAPHETPPQEYFQLAKEMRASSNTLNRIASQIYKTGNYDADELTRHANKVIATADLMHTCLVPKKMK